MIILVTGVCGYIGSKLAELLKNEGYSVYGFDKNGVKTVSKILDGFIEGNLCEVNCLESIEQNIDVVIHLAGEANVDADWRKHRQNNVIGSMNLFKWAIEKNIKRIILLSTVKVSDSGCYAKSKRDCENLLIDLCNAYDCSYTILRSTPVYGLGMKGGVASWVNQYNKQMIPDVRNSGSELAMIGLNDLCSAIQICLVDYAVENKVYKISDGIRYQVKNIDSLAKEYLGYGKAYVHIPRRLLWISAKISDVLAILGLRTPFTTSRYLMLYSNVPVADNSFSTETDMVFNENFLDMLPAIFCKQEK